MPPKVRFSREQIADRAFELVKKEGVSALTARNLASCLGTSTAPLFTAFKNIEDIKSCVKGMAVKCYEGYLSEGLAEPLPFKGAGRQYIRFAAEEPQLFKLLFTEYDVSDTVPGYHPGDSESSAKVLNTLCADYKMDEERAKWLYNHLSVYTHGLAVMFANGNSMFTADEADRMLSEVYIALCGKDRIK